MLWVKQDFAFNILLPVLMHWFGRINVESYYVGTRHVVFCDQNKKSIQSAENRTSGCGYCS